MRNIRLTLQYDGTDYSGWQIQSNGITIQKVLEDAAAVVTGERQRVTGAARTDAGVHAIKQVASFKTNSSLQADIFPRALNVNLPYDIKVIESTECPMNFHPRHNAKGKTYFYLIARAYSIFLRRYSYHIPYKLNCDLMRGAAEFLVGEHDFSSFRGSGCSSKNPVRKIIEIKIEELTSIDFMTFAPLEKQSFLTGGNINAPIIKISISATAFLRHMARNIVGTLIEVGRGKISPQRVGEILNLKDRRLSGPTAPAQGLFLERIVY